jgi:centromeric protein E
MQLEDERRALAAFVRKFDALGLGGLAAAVAEGTPPSKLRGAQAVFAERQKSRNSSLALPSIADDSPARPDAGRALALMGQASLLLEETPGPDAEWTGADDLSFDPEGLDAPFIGMQGKASALRDVFGEKENLPASR